MGIMRMGFAHIRVTDLEEANDHYANTLGLYETRGEDGKVFYKGWDEWDHHSVVIEEGGVGVVKFGWKVERPEDIDEIERKARAGHRGRLGRPHRWHDRRRAGAGGRSGGLPFQPARLGLPSWRGLSMHQGRDP